jgi:hypothetical protein
VYGLITDLRTIAEFAANAAVSSARVKSAATVFVL